MVLYEKGSQKYFKRQLLTFLRKKKNDDVRRIFEKYQSSEASLKISHLKDSTQSTLLHYAAEYGNEEIVKELIDLGSEIDAQNEFGRSPLMLALIGEHEMVIQTLLKANADIKLTDVEGKSAFQMIFELKTVSSGVFDALVQHVLVDNIVKSMPSDVVVKKLRKNGITLNQAALLGNISFIKLLLDQDYSIDERDPENGKTALHIAVEAHDSMMVKALVQFGADVDALDSSQSTPLHYLHPHKAHSDGACESLEILNVLLDRMTLLTTSNDDGWMQISNILIFGCREMVELTLQNIFDLSVVDDKGNSVVHYMAWNDDASVIKLLEGREFDVNVANKSSYTPLHWAAGEHLPHAVEFLLENKANVRARGLSDDTPLRRLCSILNSSKVDEAKKCVRLLLEYGAESFDDHLDTIFDVVSKIYTDATAAHVESEEPKEILTLLEPALAHLAADKSIDEQFIEYARTKIHVQPSWAEYFDMCEKQIEQMQKTAIFGNVTLFKFFTESQKKLTAYGRNEELVAELKKIINKYEANSPYLDSIQKRLVEAVRLAELKQKATATVYRLIDLKKNNAHYFAAEYIINYLSDGDMTNLNSVM